MLDVTHRSPFKRRLWFVLCLVIAGLCAWSITRFYNNRYALKAPTATITRSTVAMARPYFVRITHVSQRVVWTRTASELQPSGAPWHRDWLITITGTAKNPWHLHPLTLKIYVNGQHGGIEGWFIPLTHPLSR